MTETHHIRFPPSCMGGFGNPFHAPQRVELGEACPTCGLVFNVPKPWPADPDLHKAIVLEMPPRTWRMRLTDARLWWWWHLRGRYECMGKRWYQR